SGAAWVTAGTTSFISRWASFSEEHGESPEVRSIRGQQGSFLKRTPRFLSCFLHLAPNILQKPDCDLSRIELGKVFLQDQERYGRINFLERLLAGFAVHYLHVCAEEDQLCLGRFQQNPCVLHMGSGQHVVARATQHFSQEGSYINRVVHAEDPEPGI